MSDSDSSTARWGSAYEKCEGVLTFLAATQTENDLETVGTAWKMCMGAFLCKPQFRVLSAQLKAADAAAAATATVATSPGEEDDLTAQMDRAAVQPGYSAMHQCVESAMEEGVGHLIPTDGGLNGTYELITLPRRMWLEATAKTTPFKYWLQERAIDDSSWTNPTSEEAMRYKMPWVYGIGATLPPCKALAAAWASAAQLPNMAAPMEGFAKTNWNPSLEEWQKFASCVGYIAGKAATSLDNEWADRQAEDYTGD